MLGAHMGGQLLVLALDVDGGSRSPSLSWYITCKGLSPRMCTSQRALWLHLSAHNIALEGMYPFGCCAVQASPRSGIM